MQGTDHKVHKVTYSNRRLRFICPLRLLLKIGVIRDVIPSDIKVVIGVIAQLRSQGCQRQGLNPGEFRSQGMLVFVVHPEATVQLKNIQDRTVLQDGGQFMHGDVNVVKFKGTELAQR